MAYAVKFVPSVMQLRLSLLLLFCLLLTEKAVIAKRLPVGPRPGFTLENVKMETITAIPYDIVKEGLQ